MQPLFSEKTVSITYSEYAFLALGIQHAMRVRHIAIRDLSVSTIFSTLNHKRHDFLEWGRGGFLFNTKCGFLFSLYV